MLYHIIHSIIILFELIIHYILYIQKEGYNIKFINGRLEVYVSGGRVWWWWKGSSLGMVYCVGEKG